MERKMEVKKEFQFFQTSTMSGGARGWAWKFGKEIGVWQGGGALLIQLGV